MSTIKTLFAAVLAVAAMTSPSMAVGVKVLDNVRIDTSITNLTRVAIPLTMRNKGCTFYEHDNGRGESWKKPVGWLAAKYSNQDMYAEYVTYTGDWWNDRISSLQCDFDDTVKCTVAIYEHSNKGGREVVIMGASGLVNMSSYNMNDKISSFMVFCNLMK